ncbi:hypothetical protein DPMN_019381 [Dreissena polymorpha]|uniref:Uncharacterized protein n=1 Tax=Dreissena polymorpha TaxID=45954 RepID=A0A9D4NIC3_DREPO|nr:hypothetical protein DPMN_019381 [Dreissena polymorpha]
MDHELGPLMLAEKVIIADIEDEVLLGYDILKGRDGVPADILLNSNKILLDGLEISLFQVGKSNRARRVTVAKDMTLPGLAEAVVSVFEERFIEDDDEINSNFLVEPSQQFQDRYALRMAATLVDVNKSPTCRVRILNPFATEVTLRQDNEIGRTERIERIVSVIATEECAEDKGNHEAMSQNRPRFCKDTAS